jgi:hypothetical protein
MCEKQSKKINPDTAIFLMEEYKFLNESFLRNEELGERRVSFFITLATSIIGGLLATFKLAAGKIHPIITVSRHRYLEAKN